MNRKSEARITNYTYATVVVLAVLVLFSTLLVSVTSNYGVKEVPEFAEYEKIYLEINNTVDDIVGSQNIKEDDTNNTKNLYSKIIEGAHNFADTFFLIKAWNTIKLLPKMLYYTGKTINIGLSQTAIGIPPAVAWLIITIPALAVIFLLVRALWEKKT